MPEFTELTNSVAQLSPWTLVACIIIGGFLLSAYAIYAVLHVTKDRQ